ncbi:unnamed protein product [Penicillium nalgiovense]|uniref:Uncharacterized protein n=1 Tax=Penicillium nalgiovense TaxID=60175 RepID=A0A9W4IQV8_PENNA|nr:unnamed protein product [Penicillium nalgiovense]CAG7979256.1 unnamed protein product [Penicillium nalgiovense]CAG7985624.1 unnamed protein product [Penicillium nalgiovense]CAG7989302.1 unnamed protein product [Penicillium nalgiovense]CAG7991666.1 unnamed protein product [Penicillium nalgiovense]
MRMYIQVPHRKTQIDDTDTRGRQATTFSPPELTAYQDLTQKHSSNTPKLIGYKTEFVKALPKLVENGWFPTVSRASSLVCYFVGRFSKAGKRKRPVEFAEWIATFQLANPVPPVRWGDDDGDKDTSRWKW